MNAIEKAVDEWNEDFRRFFGKTGEMFSSVNLIEQLNKIAIPKDVLREKLEFIENNSDWVCPKILTNLLLGSDDVKSTICECGHEKKLHMGVNSMYPEECSGCFHNPKSFCHKFVAQNKDESQKEDKA